MTSVPKKFCKKKLFVGHVAHNTICRYGPDGDGRPDNFLYTNKSGGNQRVNISVAFTFGGIKLPIRFLEKKLTARRYRKQ